MIARGGIVLSWETAEEIDSDYFAIQRTTDGVTFTKIGQLASKGKGNLTPQYRYVDADPSPVMVNYYRLLPVDRNGAFSYSWVIAISTAGTPSSYVLYPNPARDVLHMSLPAALDRIGITVYSVSGGRSLTLAVERPGRGMNVDVSSLPYGPYFMHLRPPTGDGLVLFSSKNECWPVCKINLFLGHH